MLLCTTAQQACPVSCAANFNCHTETFIFRKLGSFPFAPQSYKTTKCTAQLMDNGPKQSRLALKSGCALVSTWWNNIRVAAFGRGKENEYGKGGNSSINRRLGSRRR
jgi:hypothetical protein